MESAVLLITYKRYDTTIQVFEAIRKARPPRLYFASNAPNPISEGEALKIDKVRGLINNIDWHCKFYTLFRKEHLSAKDSISSAINWFFENEEEGIILEDDVLPIPSFFLYCDELLARYRNNQRVGAISGNNLISKRFTTKESYFFSRYNLIWGWASWRRAWQQYDITMQAWPEWRDNGGLSSLSEGNKLFEYCWTATLNNVFQGGIDTWDYQWTFACWYHRMLIALPSNNQTYNLGFGRPDSVHTTGDTPDYLKESVPEPMTFPLQHPINVECSAEADCLIDRWVYSITVTNLIKKKILDIPLFSGIIKKIKKQLTKI